MRLLACRRVFRDGPLLLGAACLIAWFNGMVAASAEADRVAAALAVLREPHRSPPEFVQAARDRLASASPQALPQLLRAMHQRSLPVVNWLRSAGDEILDRSPPQPDALQPLLDVAADRELSAWPRRIALQWCERCEPGLSAHFLRDRLDDPIFAADAVDAVFDAALAFDRAEDRPSAMALMKQAFPATTDPEQAKRVAVQLTAWGQPVDLHRHLGVLTRWQAIGPFAGLDQAGARMVYPPELNQTWTDRFPGKTETVAWKPVELAADESFFNLKKLFGETDDAVGYLATTIHSPSEQAAELRGGGDDNLQVWFNGEQVIDAAEYYQRPRLDKHRARVRLRAGENHILAKICEVKLPPGPPAGSPPRWQFALRIVDASGRGMSLPTAPVRP